jgi:cation diffusion facilitator CzcD-associated flavoprotein CzcO
MGSSGVQIVANIQKEVEHLYTWISTPTWMTPGFAPKYSGPGGTNFSCESPLATSMPGRGVLASVSLKEQS